MMVVNRANHPVRIAIHDYAGHPFQIQLSRTLASRGYDVLHLFNASNTTPQGALLPLPDDPESFACEGIHLPQTIDKRSLLKRYRQEKHYGRLAAQRLEQWRPDIVISANTPLDSQHQLLKQCQRMHVPFIYWVQDLVGVGTQRVISRRIPALGPLIGAYYVNLERYLLSVSSHIVLIADDFRPFVPDGENSSHVTVIENWAPLDEMPLRSRVNPWSARQGVSRTRNIIYSGTLGMKHNPDLLVQLAIKYRNETPRVNVIVISGDSAIGWLHEKKKKHNLDNLILMPFQPYEEVPNVLASADVLVSILEPSAGVFSVPSKVLSYTCAGRPILLAVPPQNLAARIVQKNGLGVVAAPDDVAGFLNAADQLLCDGALRAVCGERARAFAERSFDIERIADRFEMLMATPSNCIIPAQRSARVAS